MAQILSEFLEREMLRPSQFWGERDCLMFVCNWIREKTGIDPATPYRGKYKTELECLRILRRDGGVRGIMRARTAACGFPPTDSPVDGDIALIRSRALQLGEVVNANAGGIVIGERVAVMSPEGLLLLTTPILEAWAI